MAAVARLSGSRRNERGAQHPTSFPRSPAARCTMNALPLQGDPNSLPILPDSEDEKGQRRHLGLIHVVAGCQARPGLEQRISLDSEAPPPGRLQHEGDEEGVAEGAARGGLLLVVVCLGDLGREEEVLGKACSPQGVPGRRPGRRSRSRKWACRRSR